ncbi:hypothetical protein CHARACLAT_033437 [Characodon lateralis]|uniref:Uncharacterized protein n=1 Tax=Characodon lateralis TaxID=208331 RepID=A0ABU7EF08_9TELE|nr:hypothetical protein [Characodon lateralis]
MKKVKEKVDVPVVMKPAGTAMFRVRRCEDALRSFIPSVSIRGKQSPCCTMRRSDEVSSSSVLLEELVPSERFFSETR